MRNCTFGLNDQPMSLFICGSHRFPAFSGLDDYVNKHTYGCLAFKGPIPPGEYWILDRQAGGVLQRFERLFGIRDPRDNWFALYANDAKIDDETFCDTVARGTFRLHPKGIRGISQGCITIDDPADFSFLRAVLKSSTQTQIPSTTMKAYGRVVVS